jgi:hypothetical protein
MDELREIIRDHWTERRQDSLSCVKYQIRRTARPKLYKGTDNGTKEA